MANNWPHHSPPNSGYAYPNYPPQQQQQHHYGPQQYPHQPVHQFGSPAASSPPFGFSPTAAFQHPQSQPATPRGPPPAAHSTQNNCYNCGSPDHWAQHCPEPRREVPVGDIQRQNRQYNQQPFKRPRHNYNQGYIPPVVTKYQVPPNAQAQYSGPQPYSGPAYGQPYPSPHGPHTPATGFSSPQNQWSPPPNAQFQQPYSPGGGYGPQSHSVPPSPGGNSYYGPSHQSPMSDHRVHHSPTHPPHGPPHSGHGPQSSPYAAPTPFNHNRPISKRQVQPGFQPGQNPQSMNHSSPVRSASMHSQIPASAPSESGIDDEVEGDDLGLLNMPDCPKYPGPNDEEGAQPAGYPLPANYDEFERTGGRIPAPSIEMGGMIQSAYVTSENYEELRKNIRNSRKWTYDVDDPIFNFIYDDSRNLPFEEWIERVRHRSRRVSDADGEEGELREDDHTDKYTLLEKEPYSREDSNVDLENESSESSKYYKSTFETYKPVQAKPTQAHELNSTNLQGKLRNTEEILASLGVTGTPKPPKGVRGPARTYPPPEVDTKYTTETIASVSNSMSGSPTNRDDDRNASPVLATRPKTNGTSRHDPFDPDDRSSDEDHPVTTNSQTRPDQASSRHESSYAVHPPAPPLVARRTSNFDGTAENATPAQSSKPHENGEPTPTGGYQNDHTGNSVNGVSRPPVKLRSERSYDRKRDFDDRDSSSDDQSNERRRQVDDVTPKLKRRQPKVAAAYSRRW